MASDWEKVTLVDHCQKIGSGATPRGGSSVYLEEGEIALIRSQNIYNEGFSRDGLVYITVDAAEKLKNVIVEEDDILLNITGDSVARVCMVDNSYLPARVNQHVSIIRPKAESFNAKFLRYYLTSPYMQQLMLNYSSAGATRKALTKSMIENLEVLKPSIDIQNNIAHILGTLDDKIELNRQINETLEAMAQVLFKSWFVDFDPVIDNALLAGKAIPEPLKERAELRQAQLDSGKANTNSKINDLFPSEFEFTEELGWIPKGWEVSNINNEFEVTMGQSPPGSSYNEEQEGIAFFQGSTDFGFRYPTNRIYTTEAKRLADKDDTLVSVRAPVGTVNMATQKCCIGRGLSAVRHKSGNSSYTYYSMIQLHQRFQVFESQGTVFGSINQKDFKALLQIKAPDNLLNKFEEYAGSLDNKIETNSLQIITLANLRDTLLPKLMSGELRIADTEKLAENI